MNLEAPLPAYARKALDRLDGRVVVRTSADSEEAVQKGGGYLYSVEPGGRKFPTASAKLLIDVGLLSPRGDGLIADCSQTFERRAD